MYVVMNNQEIYHKITMFFLLKLTKLDTKLNVYLYKHLIDIYALDEFESYEIGHKLEKDEKR